MITGYHRLAGQIRLFMRNLNEVLGMPSTDGRISPLMAYLSLALNHFKHRKRESLCTLYSDKGLHLWGLSERVYTPFLFLILIKRSYHQTVKRWDLWSRRWNSKWSTSSSNSYLSRSWIEFLLRIPWRRNKLLHENNFLK